jgi:hypothetical protein
MSGRGMKSNARNISAWYDTTIPGLKEIDLRHDTIQHSPLFQPFETQCGPMSVGYPPGSARNLDWPVSPPVREPIHDI